MSVIISPKAIARPSLDRITEEQLVSEQEEKCGQSEQEQIMEEAIGIAEENPKIIINDQNSA